MKSSSASHGTISLMQKNTTLFFLGGGGGGKKKTNNNNTLPQLKIQQSGIKKSVIFFSLFILKSPNIQNINYLLISKLY
jgi:hypothetical protein